MHLARTVVLAGLASGVGLAWSACLPGAACNTQEDCPAPLECNAGRCSNPATGSSGSSSSSGVPPGPPTNCREYLAQNPGTADGVQAVQVPGDGGVKTINVWCDMTVAGGGWTLVGRSVDTSSGSTPSFGWRSTTGSVTDDSRAYSLNVARNPIAFTEVLFGAYSTGKSWTNAYRVTVPADFLDAFRNDALDVWPPEPAVGACDPPDPMGQPGFMGRHVGFTSNNEVFFFRDNPQELNFGLNHQTWNLSGDDTDCMRNGLLQGHEGMVMVR